LYHQNDRATSERADLRRISHGDDASVDSPHTTRTCRLRLRASSGRTATGNGRREAGKSKAEVHGNRSDQRNQPTSNELGRSPFPFGTESGTVQDETGTFRPHLMKAVSALMELSEADRQAVLAIVRKAAGATLAE